MWLLGTSVKANSDAFCIVTPPHFFFTVAIRMVSFTTCVQKKLSPFQSAWQTESSEDKKPFLAWNALWNVFENKVVNNNCHQNLALSNAFFIVSRPQRACCIFKFQMVGWLHDRQASIFKDVQAHMKVHLCIWLSICKRYLHILLPETDELKLNGTVADSHHSAGSGYLWRLLSWERMKKQQP